MRWRWSWWVVESGWSMKPKWCRLPGAYGGRSSQSRQPRLYRGISRVPQISAAHPVYAQLRNLVDLTIAAAFIQDGGLYEQADWDLGVFASEDGLAVELLPPPKQVETAINAVRRGQTLITPIGGGVIIKARRALQPENLHRDDGSVDQARQALDVGPLAEGQWWWD